ncbi:hypothetical protein SAOR_11505 [Salinisphaera orenii MK-B5]|uniref:Uncharacterized protein n=2 Tax=Salinisphaera TaxID=180541 RepID=A0A423PL51_9GAMM|nr:hypothetical protein SAOR_11505 [Salinisphaera orenii MK-B5]
MLCDVVMDPHEKSVGWARGPKTRISAAYAKRLLRECELWRDDIDRYREFGDHEFDTHEFRGFADEIEQRARMKGTSMDLALEMIAESRGLNFYTLRDKIREAKRLEGGRLVETVVERFGVSTEEAIDFVAEHYRHSKSALHRSVNCEHTKSK